MSNRLHIVTGLLIALLSAVLAALPCVPTNAQSVVGGASPASDHVTTVGLTREAAEQALAEEWAAWKQRLREERAEEFAEDVIRIDGHEMRLLTRTFGDAPEGGRRLWISMHGGGGTTAEVNDQQWRNQIRLYEPSEGIYIAPRAPSNTWNLWHRAEIDRLFDRLIETAVAVHDVDPDRVYLLGYSAGGDGVYQLAPRMADRFAAAAMMAGHPNDAAPEGLRNLPFAIFMGARDSAYNRNTVAEEWGRQLAALRDADPEGYPHRVTIYPEMGHWMNGRDREAIPWMADKVRDPWPDRVVWKQGNVTHTRFYWLTVAPDDAVRNRTIIAEVSGQTITIASEETSRLTLRLRDELVDLDEPIRVIVNGRMIHEGRVMRTLEAIRASLAERGDPRSAATATLTLSW